MIQLNKIEFESINKRTRIGFQNFNYKIIKYKVTEVCYLYYLESS